MKGFKVGHRAIAFMIRAAVIIAACIALVGGFKKQFPFAGKAAERVAARKGAGAFVGGDGTAGRMCVRGVSGFQFATAEGKFVVQAVYIDKFLMMRFLAIVA